MHISASSPRMVELHGKHLIGPIVAAAALAALTVWLVVTFAFTSAPENAYVHAIVTMTPAERVAAFGTGNVDAIDGLGLTPKEERYVRAISSMTPTQLVAAFGTDQNP